jgi:hypothetical protein
MQSNNSYVNMSNQKYEVANRMQRYINALNKAKPNRETTSWREGTPKLVQDKRSENREVQRKNLIEENKRIKQRVADIKNEDRISGSHESTPGWRVIKKGAMVIDCYPAQRCAIHKFRNLHGRETEIKRHQKKIERDNEELKRHLECVKSHYSAIDLENDYKEKYKIFINDFFLHYSLSFLIV